jgi:hypothetical protein
VPILDDKADDTEPDEKLQKMARLAITPAPDVPAAPAVEPPHLPVADSGPSSGDETEEDAELILMVPGAAETHADAPLSLDYPVAAVVPDAAAAAPAPAPLTPEELEKQEVSLTPEQRRTRYKCGDDYTTLDKIPTWQ